jgi:hypothetical protein
VIDEAINKAHGHCQTTHACKRFASRLDSYART